MRPDLLLKAYRKALGGLTVIDENDGFKWGFIPNRLEWLKKTQPNRDFTWYISDLMLDEVAHHLGN